MMITTSHCSAEGADPEQANKLMKEMWGPHAVDQFIRQAVSTCWMMLPAEKKATEFLEQEIRRLVDRAVKDFKEDMAAFGVTTSPSARPK